MNALSVQMHFSFKQKFDLHIGQSCLLILCIRVRRDRANCEQ